MTVKMSQARFDLLAIGTRRSLTKSIAKELSWWATLDVDVIGTVFLDLLDEDFGWILLVKDLVGRFRCSEVDASLQSERVAEASLRVHMSQKTRDPTFKGFEAQGDEPKKLLNLFEPLQSDQSKLHPYFLNLRDRTSRTPAKKVLEAISPWLVTSDPHLVKEFQETQFDQRLWEIYLWAMFRDRGYDVTHCVAPDLLVRSSLFRFAVEATTVAPSISGPLSVHPNPRTPDELQAFAIDYMPMKFGSSLISKLTKKDAQGRHYWEKPEVLGGPFTIAIADFHRPADINNPGSMVFSQGGLYIYLYGLRVRPSKDNNGKVKMKYDVVLNHAYGGKTIPSGFFAQPGAENVSAVIFSNAATIAKFDRIGVLAGFAPPFHKYIRTGFAFDPDPEALVGIPFQIDVEDPSYNEYWGDEVQVYHNPTALHPIPKEAFPDAAQFFLENGEMSTIDRSGRVLSSITTILCPKTSDDDA